jgi:tetraacyldisaccharide 4'-kinase
VILLDDAFQHRYVKPGINILLVDYHRLIIYDKLLPAGRLREPLSGKNRADIVIITKCPKDLKPMEFRVLTKSMDLYPYQSLFFSTIDYDTLYPLFNKEENKITKQQLKGKNVLLVSGIASPKQIIVDMKQHVTSITPLSFADHHQFSSKDAERINQAFANIKGNKIIITTEKDATRLEDIEGLDDDVKSHIYVLPIKVRFMLNQENVFNDKIIDYVRKNSRNSILAKGKDDNKSKDSDNSGNRPGTISFRNNR